MNERFNQLPEERKAQILNGAMQAFAEHGYDKCSMADVAMYAGVSKPLIFHYFGTKIELFDYLNVYANMLKRQAQLKPAIKPDEDLLEAFSKTVKQRVAFVQLNPVAYRFLKQAEFTAHLQHPDQGAADLLKADTHRLRKGFSAPDTVRLLGWVGDGFVEEHLRANSSGRKTLEDLDTLLASLKKMLYKDKHK